MNELWEDMSKTDLKNEIWKDIIDYENIFKVSNLGRVRSLDRYITYRVGEDKRLRKGKIRRLHMRDKNTKWGSYISVILGYKGKTTTFNVHTLVANAFIVNSFNKEYVNHINGIKTDNRVENLEWVTAKENVRHAWETGLVTLNKLKKKVLMSNLNNIPLLWFESIAEASRATNIKDSQIIGCCKGKKWFTTAGGYKWSYYNN